MQSGNRAFYTMFGISRERAQGTELRSLGDDTWKASALWAELKVLTNGDGELPPLEIERDLPENGRRTILFEARRVRPIDDGSITILLSAHDVTERKRTEEELQSASRRKDEFLALLAHELRNPLAPIRTGLELMRVAGDTPESLGRVRAIMERQIGQMVRLIDDLLDVSRITSGKIALQRTADAGQRTDPGRGRCATERDREFEKRACRRIAGGPLCSRCRPDSLRADPVERAAQCVEVHSSARNNPVFGVDPVRR